MRGFLRGSALAAVLGGASAAGAVDLNGKWRFESSSVPPFIIIIQITQSGSALSIPYGVPFTGTVGATDPDGFTPYSVSWTDGMGSFAGLDGRVMPSGNLLDGRGGAFFPAGAAIPPRDAMRLAQVALHGSDSESEGGAGEVLRLPVGGTQAKEVEEADPQPRGGGSLRAWRRRGKASEVCPAISCRAIEPSRRRQAPEREPYASG
jgi:hypothetical protein